MNSRKIVAAAFVVYALGMFYRLFSLLPPAPSIDIAAFAVQALHVLQGKTPIFYYGQKFMGTGGVYLIALFYKIFGTSYFTLQLFGYITMGFTLFFSVLLALRFFGPWCGFWTAVMLAVPGRMMYEWAHIPNPDYAFTFLLAPALLILCHKLILLAGTCEAEKQRQGLFALTGLISGFGMWNNLQLGTCVVWTFFLFMCYYRLRFFRYFWAYLFCFCIGFLPEIYANLTMGFFIFKMGAVDSLHALPHKAFMFFTKAVPFFWGWEDISLNEKMTVGWLFFQAWLGIVYILFICLGFSRKTDDRFKKGFYVAFGFLSYHLFVNFITVFGHRFGHGEFPTPYLQVLYCVALLVPAAVLSSPSFSKGLRFVLFLPVLIYLGHNALNNIPQMKDCISYVQHKGLNVFASDETGEDDPFLKFYRENNLEGGYVDGPIISQVRFDLRAKISLSNPYQEGFFPESIPVDAGKKIFWGGLYPESLEDNFRYLGCDFQTFQAGGLLNGIFYDFKKKSYVSEKMVEGYQFKSGINTLNNGFVNDRNALTLWSTARCGLKGDSFTLEWKEACPVSKIVFIPDKQENLPRDFSLWTTTDGKEWKKYRAYPENIGPVFYSVFHPFVKIVKPRMELAMDGSGICGIRVTLDKDSLSSVSLREIYVYEKTGETGRDSYEASAEEVIRAVMEINDKQSVIVADHWFESRFFKEGFRVEFTPNWSVDVYGTDNPHLLKLIPLDFANWDHILISEKNHSPQTEERLRVENIPFQKKNFDCFDLFSIPRLSGNTSLLYWDGLQLLSLSASKIKYPDLSGVVSGSLPLNLTFGDLFRVNSYALSQTQEKIQFFFDLQLLKPVKKDYFLFIHFCDEEGRILFQGDFLPAGALGSALNWVPLNNVLVENTIQIPSHVRGKKGKILIGMWNPSEGKNLSVNSSKETRFQISSWEIQ